MKFQFWTAIIGLILFMSCAGYAADKDITVVRVTPALDMDQIRYILSHEREQVFERGMVLNEKQWDKFWRVYDEYEKERQKLDAKRLRLLGTFINKHGTMSNEEATKLVDASRKNQQADLALRQKYFKILSKKLNPVAAARFVQLDDVVGMVVRLSILGNVPLITGTAEAVAEPESSPQTGERQPGPSEQSSPAAPQP
ncbi:exported protein of unknown function [Nitrospira japonica]|uniref:Uncharacterized protein n=1 Tax=Nitrospira japonica TaxID=1325564 RepID=A0A1W1I7T1_9BACT|nr:hypothetical protein [Nitrospira japonica]SLM49067.1 exported protein of unknown function [Nitrospira japonica]